MKKFIYTLIIGITMFIGINGVGAKETEKTCTYYFSNRESNFDTITCSIYDDNTHSCVLSNAGNKTNKEKFGNWNKNWYSENKRCPNYAIYLEKDALVDNYEISQYDDYQSAMEYQTNRKKFYDKVYIFPLTSSKDSNGNVEEIEQMTAENQIQEYINYFKNFDENSQLLDYCEKNEEGIFYAPPATIYTDPTRCREQKARILEMIDEWNNKVINFINNNLILSSNPLIDEYENYSNMARKSLGTTDTANPENSATNPIDIREEAEEIKNREFSNGKTLNFLRRMYNFIKIIIPILIIALSIIDFLKVILISDDKNYKSAWDKFIKRLIIGVIFFLVPVIVSFLLNYSGIGTEQSYLEIFK